MDERIARLRTHQKNIDRYQDLLKAKPSEAEKHCLEKRLSEDTFRDNDAAGPSSGG
jgi:hypothetical protein